MSIKTHVLVLMLAISPYLFADEDNRDLISNQEMDPISAMKISKPEILQTLKMLRDSGKISAEDYQKSIADIEKMDDKHLNALTDQAKDMAKKNPDAAMNLLKDKKIDYKKVEELKNQKKMQD